jgi:hypothetical protein
MMAPRLRGLPGSARLACLRRPPGYTYRTSRAIPAVALTAVRLVLGGIMGLRTARVLALAIAVAAVAAGSLSAHLKAADKKWTGKISDSMCGKSHGDNGGTIAKDHDCTVKCVKGGAQYVFIVGEKIYKLADQKNPALEQGAGHTVEITGTMKGDTITITMISIFADK